MGAITFPFETKTRAVEISAPFNGIFGPQMFSTTQKHFLLALICFLFLVQNPWNSPTCTAVVVSFTSHNQVLFGFVFKKTENIDWLQCIQACQQDVSCVSYNYWPTESGGKCEMNSCGFKDKCSAERMLTWVREGTFQQLKQTKVHL